MYRLLPLPSFLYRALHHGCCYRRTSPRISTDFCLFTLLYVTNSRRPTSLLPSIPLFACDMYMLHTQHMHKWRLPAQVIYTTGEPITGLYFLVTGRVDLLWGVPQHPSAMKQQDSAASAPAGDGERRERGAGDAFGELGLFPELCPGCQPETAVARDWGLAHMLPVRKYGMGKAWLWLCEWLLIIRKQKNRS